MIHECDVAVIGGGLGGVAAALRACRAGLRVCLTEPAPWLGGQATSQGVSALEEHDHIETFGGTAAYCEFRGEVRRNYRMRLPLSQRGQAAPHFSPGDAWASRLSFEPDAGVVALLGMLLPEVESGRLEILYRVQPVAAERRGDEVRSVTVSAAEAATAVEIRAAYVLEATDLGDLMPLLDVPDVCGAEAREQTGEPHARHDGPRPDLTEAFAIPFAVDLRPGESHVIPQPPRYEDNRDGQPYALTLRTPQEDLRCRLFETERGQPGPFWTRLRVLAADQFAEGTVDGDVAMILCPANDFKGGDLVGASPAQRAELVRQARELSLGLLYWLQTEVPRDGGGRGYPELRPRGDVMGTSDGLSMGPYVRESRRLLALTTVREQDVSAACQPGARAAPFRDSAGVGWHPIAVCGRPGDASVDVSVWGPTRPFQIPLGALIPRHGPVNLLAAGRGIGVTHLTNSCFRPHPVEWNIGEAAGALAAFCLGEGVRPATVHGDERSLRRFQARLLEAGVPLYWYPDLPLGHPALAAAQMLAVRGIWPGVTTHLAFDPEALVTPAQRQELLRCAGVGPDALGVSPRSRAEAALALGQALARD